MIPRLERRDVRADALDDPRPLVPEHGRRIPRRIGSRSGVQIRVANPASHKPNERFARTRLSEVDLLHNERLPKLLEHSRANLHTCTLRSRDRRGVGAWDGVRPRAVSRCDVEWGQTPGRVPPRHCSGACRRGAELVPRSSDASGREHNTRRGPTGETGFPREASGAMRQEGGPTGETGFPREASSSASGRRAMRHAPHQKLAAMTT